MKLLFSLLLLAGLSFGGWFLFDNNPTIHNFVRERLGSGDFRTLEIRYTAEQIMEAHRHRLLKNEGYTFLEPKLTFYPYLLMEVKYTKDADATGEGVLLWGLTDGEMVIDTTTWEKTHGFEDCLLAKADKNDFKILKTVVAAGGAIDREKLYQKFQVESDILDEWVENCRSKKLIAITGSKLRLHFENPLIEVTPVTRLDEGLVTIPAKYSARANKNYPPSQIKRLTTEAFGSDFAIRKMKEVFLPVYSISVQNPDGSTLTTRWNALNGKRFE